MKIVIDVMSGDNAPDQIIKGAFLALEAFPEIEVVMAGDKATIEKVCAENNLDLNNNRISILASNSVITMEDEPMYVVREKADSSMAKALKMLAHNEADALVSAGNTGALHAGSTLIVRRIKGIFRSAIATLIPFQTPMLLIDSGANTHPTKEQMEQFAVMGSVYMKKIFGIEKPRVGLANIGAEPTKGTKYTVEIHNHLNASKKINFVGNIEGKQIPFSCCDVLVCDGFTGNIILKFTEGFASFMLKNLKGVFKASLGTKLAYLFTKKHLKDLKNSFDPSEYGGAPMLGISKPVIKAHGSSDAKAILNAVRQALAFTQTGLINELAAQLQTQTENTEV